MFDHVTLCIMFQTALRLGPLPNRSHSSLALNVTGLSPCGSPTALTPRQTPRATATNTWGKPPYLDPAAPQDASAPSADTRNAVKLILTAPNINLTTNPASLLTNSPQQTLSVSQMQLSPRSQMQLSPRSVQTHSNNSSKNLGLNRVPLFDGKVTLTQQPNLTGEGSTSQQALSDNPQEMGCLTNIKKKRTVRVVITQKDAPPDLHK